MATATISGPASDRTIAPTRAWRLLFAVALGTASGVYVYALGRSNPEFVSDFDQIWVGGRTLWQGLDPYLAVGPGRAFDWKWPLYYPMPALLVAAPLALLPLLVARAIFAATGAALLAWGATHDGWSRLPVFLSVPFMVTVELGQWSTFFAAAFFLPWLATIGTAKPNFGMALAGSARTERTWIALATGSAVLLAASWVIKPDWHTSWLDALSGAEHFVAPVRRPFGFLLLLALLRWRRPEARWLLAISLTPQAPSFYEPLLLGMVCLTSRESLVFALSTLALFFYVGFNTPQPDYRAWGALVGNGTTWLCALPALLMVLRRPNEGEVPRIDRLWRRTARGQVALH